MITFVNCRIYLRVRGRRQQRLALVFRDHGVGINPLFRASSPRFWHCAWLGSRLREGLGANRTTITGCCEPCPVAHAA
jgi:hypothetical protein